MTDDDKSPTPGRDYVRTVACGHCESTDVTGVECGEGSGGVWVAYRCDGCGGYTWLTALPGDAGRVYVSRERLIP